MQFNWHKLPLRQAMRGWSRFQVAWRGLLMSQCLFYGCVSYSSGKKNQGQCETGANGQKFEVLGMVFDPYFGVIPNGPPEFSISHRKLDTESHPVLIANATKRFCQSNDRYLFGFLEGWQGGGANREVQEIWNVILLIIFSAFRSPFLLTIFFSLLGWVGLVHFGCVSTFFHFFSRDYCLPSGGISHWGFARCGGITLHFRTATGLPICFSCEWKGHPPKPAPATIVTLDEWFCPRYTDPEVVPHSSELLPGISEQPVVGGLRSAGPFLLPWEGWCTEVVNAADMDEGARMKGFGGEPVAWPW